MHLTTTSEWGHYRWTPLSAGASLRDEEGYLPEAYCSDPEDQGIHFTDLACGIWIEYLYTHTR